VFALLTGLLRALFLLMPMDLALGRGINARIDELIELAEKEVLHEKELSSWLGHSPVGFDGLAL
jgi:hypothetical protein